MPWRDRSGTTRPQSQLEPPWINAVTQFGAIGDGVNDDTVPIRNAVNAAGARGGGMVFLPYHVANYYLTTGNIAIPANVTLIGEGDMTCIRCDASTLTFTLNDGSQLRNLKLQSRRQNVGQMCVRYIGNDGVIENCTIDSSANCVSFGDPSVSRTPLRCTLKGCRLIASNGLTTGVGWTAVQGRVGTDGVNDCNHRVVDNNITQYAGHPGIEMWTGGTLIHGNKLVAPLKNGGAGGITVGAFPSQIITSNRVVGFSYGIEAGNNGPRLIIANNEVVGAFIGITDDTAGNQIETDVVISGNNITITDDWPGAQGYSITAATQVTITGGSIRYETALPYTDPASRGYIGVYADSDSRRLTMLGVLLVNLAIGVRAAATSGDNIIDGCTFDNCTYVISDSGGVPRTKIANCLIHNTYTSLINRYASFTGCTFHNEADFAMINKPYAQCLATGAAAIVTNRDNSFVNVLDTCFAADAAYALPSNGYTRPALEIRDEGWRVTNVTDYSAAIAALVPTGLALPYDMPLHTWSTDVHWVKTKNGVVGSGAAPPTTGTWSVGDKIYNTAPATAGFIGWVCTVAGTGASATWKTFGLIS